MLRPLLLCAPAFAIASLSPLDAQTTRIVVPVHVGGPGKPGCQQTPTDPPTLDNGVVASATVTFHFLLEFSILRVKIENTSPVIQAPNALLRDVWFNLPRDAVTSARIVSQQAAGGVDPDFTLSFDPDTTRRPDTNLGACFGSFSVQLTTRNGVANPRAGSFNGIPIVGPVDLVIRLDGPGVGSISSETIYRQLSTRIATTRQVANVAAHFRTGNGPLDGGVMSNAVERCSPSLYLDGPPRIGSSFRMCAAAKENCLAHLWFSDDLVPNGRLPMDPIAIVILGVQDRTQRICGTISLPNEPRLVGFAFFFLHVSLPITATDLTDLYFSDVFPLIVAR